MLTLTSAQQAQFVNDACLSIRHEHQIAWRKIATPVPVIPRRDWEVHCLAHLCKSMKGVVAGWQSALSASASSARFDLASVFTHQSPYVIWPVPPLTGLTSQCELADLLVAVMDTRKNPMEGYAVLIQAKQSDSYSEKLTLPPERTQFELLATRPVFRTRAAAGPQSVDLSSYSPDAGLIYGLCPPDLIASFSAAAAASHSWCVASNLASSTRYVVQAPDCLAQTLVDLLRGKTGWRFEVCGSGQPWTYFQSGPQKDDWSMLINYLLQETFKKPLKKVSSAMGQPNRGEIYSLYARTPQSQKIFDLHGYRRSGWLADFLRSSRGMSTSVSQSFSQEQMPIYKGRIVNGNGGWGDGGDGNFPEEPDDGGISTILITINGPVDG